MEVRSKILALFMFLATIAGAQGVTDTCDYLEGGILERQMQTGITGLLRGSGYCVQSTVVNGGLEMVGATLSVVDGDTTGQVLRWNGTTWVPRLIIFPASEVGVDTAYNGLTDRDTAFVLGGPLVEHTTITGQQAYDFYLSNMRTIYMEAQRTSGVAFSSVTMGSTAVAGVDFAHYNEADNQKQAVAAVNYSTGNVMKVQDSATNGTYFQQYDNGGGLFQTDITSSNGATSKTIRVNRDAVFVINLEHLDISNEAAFMMIDTFTGELKYKSPADFSGLYGDDWGSQTVSSTARFSGNGTSGSPLELAQQSATSGQVLKWSGSTWAPAADADTDTKGPVDVVADSTAFRAYNRTGYDVVIMADSLRGGKFRRCYSCTADQYMTFSDALGRKWERFGVDSRYNAKWFGAKGAGITDDRWYLQFLADYINSKGGGVLYMPKGTYNVSKKTSTGVGLSLWDNTTLEGDGWQTIFNYTETFTSASSAAIGSRSGNADRSQAQQDSGNVNITIRDLKINFTTKVNRRGNGIGLGGTVGGKIHNVWVNGSGGYSIHIVKNNDTALAEGKRSENIGISNCLITDFGDTGIEFSGTNNCTAANCEISGPGLASDIGSAVIVWNGSTNTTISNITIKATANAVSSGIVGVWIQPSYNPLSTPNYKQTSKTVVSNISAENCHYGLVIGTDEAGPIWGKSKNTIISNCVFTGNPLYGIGIQVNNADTTIISNCKVSDFSRNIDVSSTQTFSNQRNVNLLAIKNCVFWGGLTPNFNAITGVNDLEFNGNVIENTPSTGITFRGLRGATVNDNTFKNIGTSGNVSATVFNNGNGTDTRASKHITANNNRLVDDRATKSTFFCIQFAGGTDSCLVMGNDARGGKSGAIAYTNAGTGTSIKFKDTYTGEPYNSDQNSDAIADAVLTTNSSAVGVWLSKTSLFTASNGVRVSGNDFQLGRASTAVGNGDRTATVYHNLRGFKDIINTDVGTALAVDGATGDVGIRTSSPLASFHIAGGGNFRMNDGFKFTTDGGNNAEFSSPGNLYFYGGTPIGSSPSGQPELSVNNNLVGIRTNDPQQNFHVEGTMRITGNSGTATGLMGRDADGDVSGVGLSVGLEFSGSNIQADIGSGLNISGNDIAWGGTLTENTTVDVDGFDLEFVGLPTATTEEDVMLVGTGGLLVKGTIPITAIRAPGEATYSGANGATGETVTWQPEDVNVDADPTAGHLTVELNGGMYTGVHYSLFGCCNLTYNIILSGTMKLTGEYGTVASYTLTAGQHLEVVKFSDNSFRVSKK